MCQSTTRGTMCYVYAPHNYRPRNLCPSLVLEWLDFPINLIMAYKRINESSSLAFMSDYCIFQCNPTFSVIQHYSFPTLGVSEDPVTALVTQMHLWTTSPPIHLCLYISCKKLHNIRINNFIFSWMTKHFFPLCNIPS